MFPHHGLLRILRFNGSAEDSVVEMMIAVCPLLRQRAYAVIVPW